MRETVKAENEAEAREREGGKTHRSGEGLKMQRAKEAQEGENSGDRRKEHKGRKKTRQTRKNKQGKRGRWNGGIEKQSKSATQKRTKQRKCTAKRK